jgi:sulfur carrier protein ThiS
MEIVIEFSSYLKKYSLTGEQRVNLLVETGITVKDLWDKIGFPSNIETITIVNGAYYPDRKRLKHGDIVKIYPALTGG